MRDVQHDIDLHRDRGDAAEDNTVWLACPVALTRQGGGTAAEDDG